MLIRFWCDSDITFSGGLLKNLVPILYFSIINVLCEAGGDTGFVPQANLVYLVPYTKVTKCQALLKMFVFNRLIYHFFFISDG